MSPQVVWLGPMHDELPKKRAQRAKLGKCDSFWFYFWVFCPSSVTATVTITPDFHVMREKNINESICCLALGPTHFELPNRKLNEPRLGLLGTFYGLVLAKNFIKNSTGWLSH